MRVLLAIVFAFGVGVLVSMVGIMGLFVFDWIVQKRRAMMSDRWMDGYRMSHLWAHPFRPEMFEENYDPGPPVMMVRPECVDNIELLADSLTRSGRKLLDE